MNESPFNDSQGEQRHIFLRELGKLTAQGGPATVFQPIHDITDLSVIGFGALSRFPSD